MAAKNNIFQPRWNVQVINFRVKQTACAYHFETDK